jgi:hypothetical protein
LDVVSGEGYHIETAIHSLKAPILSAEPQTGGFKQRCCFCGVTLAAASPYRALRR